MRGCLIAILLALSFSAAASSTLRVGNRLLVAGDSAAKVTELLGRPSHVSHGARARGHTSRRRRGVVVANPASERWQYRRDGHTITVVMVDGAVAEIQQHGD